MYTTDTMAFNLDPENPEAISDVDIKADSGTFDTDPSNGGFSLTWSRNLITVTVAKYGDGNGGEINLKLKDPSEATYLSLKKALSDWKTVYETQRRTETE